MSVLRTTEYGLRNMDSGIGSRVCGVGIVESASVTEKEALTASEIQLKATSVGRWVVGLLGCWVAGLLGCRVDAFPFGPPFDFPSSQCIWQTDTDIRTSGHPDSSRHSVRQTANNQCGNTRNWFHRINQYMLTDSPLKSPDMPYNI